MSRGDTSRKGNGIQQRDLRLASDPAFSDGRYDMQNVSKVARYTPLSRPCTAGVTRANTRSEPPARCNEAPISRNSCSIALWHRHPSAAAGSCRPRDGCSTHACTSAFTADSIRTTFNMIGMLLAPCLEVSQPQQTTAQIVTPTPLGHSRQHTSSRWGAGVGALHCDYTTPSSCPHCALQPTWTPQAAPHIVLLAVVCSRLILTDLAMCHGRRHATRQRCTAFHAVAQSPAPEKGREGGVDPAERAGLAGHSSKLGRQSQHCKPTDKVHSVRTGTVGTRLQGRLLPGGIVHTACSSDTNEGNMQVSTAGGRPVIAANTCITPNLPTHLQQGCLHCSHIIVPGLHAPGLWHTTDHPPGNAVAILACLRVVWSQTSASGWRTTPASSPTWTDVQA
jgi:hypothetical protein